MSAGWRPKDCVRCGWNNARIHLEGVGMVHGSCMTVEERRAHERRRQGREHNAPHGTNQYANRPMCSSGHVYAVVGFTLEESANTGEKTVRRCKACRAIRDAKRRRAA